MAKSNPIGVRFNLEILKILDEKQGCKTPQQALNFLESLYIPKKLAEIEKPKEPDNDTEILKQIEIIEAETEPTHIKTPLGRSAWHNDKIKRIWALKAKLKKK